MPGRSGLEFCREVRADSGTDFTYFILLTARSGEGDYLEGMSAGVDDFIASLSRISSSARGCGWRSESSICMKIFAARTAIWNSG